MFQRIKNKVKSIISESKSTLISELRVKNGSDIDIDRTFKNIEYFSFNLSIEDIFSIFSSCGLDESKKFLIL
jgi:hypothetical protein